MNRSQTVEEPDLTSRARAAATEQGPLDLPEVWGHGSFPASDPPANW
jgi:nitric oxide reductase large subunit